MKTRWEHWNAQLGQVTALYEARRRWATNNGIWLLFSLYIKFESDGRFFARVVDWMGEYLAEPKMFESLSEALEYLSDVDCEKYLDKHRKEFQKMI